LGSRAVAVLNQWFQLNRNYPYPDDDRTDQLANEAGKIKSYSVATSYLNLGITQKQVKKWFANKRVRSQMCYKPLYRSRKVKFFSTVFCNLHLFFKGSKSTFHSNTTTTANEL
jgi:hypothetical protein